MMDDLAEQLATSFDVSGTINSTAAQHPRFSQYKAKPGVDQEKRRQDILLRQKEKRFNAQSHVRQLATNSWGQVELMETSDTHYKPGRFYKHQLMLSEWLVDVPQRFQEDYILVLCPVGRRNLIVSGKGITTAYAKGGWQVKKFRSQLPGGCKYTKNWQTESAVLDCIFCEITGTYYVLDMMFWRSQSLYDTEAAFRFFWMGDRLSEMPQLSEVATDNAFRFEVLPNFACDNENMAALLKSDLKLKLDGLLFFHKRSYYSFGSTPLVLWLKAYMLPDILGVQVPDSVLATKPSTYTTFEKHVENVSEEQKEEVKKQGKQQKAFVEKRMDRKGDIEQVEYKKATVLPASVGSCLSNSQADDDDDRIASLLHQRQKDDMVFDESDCSYRTVPVDTTKLQQLGTDAWAGTACTIWSKDGTEAWGRIHDGTEAWGEASGWPQSGTDAWGEASGWTQEGTQVWGEANGWTQQGVEAEPRNIDWTQEGASYIDWNQEGINGGACATGWTQEEMDGGASNAGWEQEGTSNAGWEQEEVEAEASNTGWTQEEVEAEARNTGWTQEGANNTDWMQEGIEAGGLAPGWAQLVVREELRVGSGDELGGDCKQQ